MLQGVKVDGLPCRLFFETRRAAEIKLSELIAHGKKVKGLAKKVTVEQCVDAGQAIELLAPYGKSLVDAAKFMADYLARSTASCTVTELVEKLLKDQRADGASDVYIRDLTSRLSRFCSALDQTETTTFGERKVSTITTDEINDYLRALELSPLGRNNYRRCLHVCFASAVPKYCLENPITTTKQAKVVEKAPGILKPEAFDRLINVADERIRPMLALSAFAGVRPAEVRRLTWADVDLEQRHVEITAEKAKTAGARFIPICDNLLAWLLRSPSRVGLVVIDNLGLERKLTLEARSAAGITEWPADGLRHSWVTYRYALTNDAARTAAEAGHTQAVLFKYYRRPVPKVEGEKWFAILPHDQEGQGSPPIPFDQAAQA